MSRTGTTTKDRDGGSSRRRPAERRTGASVTSLRDRRRDRRRGRSGRRRRALQAGLGVLVLGLLAWALWAGPLLAVRSVQVDGTTTLPAELVRETAGIDDGTPLLRVDVDAARDAVAELPQVESVTVSRGWPSRVVVTVVERTPLAVVGEPGRRSLLDARGVLFDTVTGEPPAGVVPLAVAEPGPDDPATTAALTAIGALPAGIREQLGLVEAPGPGALVLTLTDGTVVRWGGPEESEDKARILAALLDEIDAGTVEPATELDLSVPDAVVLR
ncbi:FtsQ-type POTRA domain-containing protein [Blastococcus sp. TML/M2B]|uniref:cell division protein FtsQ/DivIB n=1 Tax=unclassified Blastococcus TaxID=2619396 RepID=UPI00190AAC48|nr:MULTISPECIES: FtsQ-type POTRA domain-containing protein [unclassified Blastococcus]MBN1092421.1 FtsQ-type POTRA domain-containing protein [Blastococcus sp. TML/M2B]MBN1097485.1 FtsQ-type POTRA domain-containing protein [Blastococcus sp. TML/C7B]